MKKEEVLKYLEDKSNASAFVVRTDDEEKSYLDNYRNSVLDEVDKTNKSELKKALDSYDEAVFEALGKKKPATVKTTDFIKGEFHSLKEAADKTESLRKQIAELEKGSPSIEAKVREIESLQSQIEKLKQGHQQEIDTLQKQTLKDGVRADLLTAKALLKFKGEIPQNLQEMLFDKTVDELSANVERRDGKFIYLDKDGKALRDLKTLVPHTAETLLKEKMKDILDIKPPKKGPGIIENPVKKVDGKTEFNFTLPDSVKDKAQLGEYLVKELGIKRNTQDYRDAYAKYSDALPMPN